MTYATQADLSALYGDAELIQLCNRTGGSTMDAPALAVLARALDSAESMVDGWVSTRYSLPLSSVPALLVEVACDIARWRLYGQKPTEEVRARYEDAIDTLRAIAKGSITLPLADGAPVTASGGLASSAPAAAFSVDTTEAAG